MFKYENNFYCIFTLHGSKRDNLFKSTRDMFIQKLILAGFYALEKWNNREQRNTESGDFLEISAHLFAVRSLAGSNRLQAELGISLLHLLHTAVNKTSWKNKQKRRNTHICLIENHHTLKTFQEYIRSDGRTLTQCLRGDTFGCMVLAYGTAG